MKATLVSPLQKSYTEAVIDGLFSGLAGGIAMLLFLIVVGALSGQSLLGVINRFSPDGQQLTPLTSVLLHLGVSAIYGVVYGVLINSLPASLRQRLPGWSLGLAYGLVLYLLARFFLLPGTGSLLLQLPAWQFIGAHIVYGTIAGMLFARQMFNESLA